MGGSPSWTSMLLVSTGVASAWGGTLYSLPAVAAYQMHTTLSTEMSYIVGVDFSTVSVCEIQLIKT